MLNIFIQHQYPVQTEAYKIHSTISYEQLTREFTRNRGGSKCSIVKRSKINPNVNQLIKSTVFGGARGEMVIVVGNGHCDTSSNPGRD